MPSWSTYMLYDVLILTTPSIQAHGVRDALESFNRQIREHYNRVQSPKLGAHTILVGPS